MPGQSTRLQSELDLCAFHPLIRAETDQFCAASAADDEVLIQARQELNSSPVRQRVSEPLYGRPTHSSSSYHHVRLLNMRSKSGPSPRQLLKTFWSTSFKFSVRSEREQPEYDQIMPNGISKSSTKWNEEDAARAYDALARQYRGTPACHGTRVCYGVGPCSGGSGPCGPACWTRVT